MGSGAFDWFALLGGGGRASKTTNSKYKTPRNGKLLILRESVLLS
jgi:hypothetical protein